MKKGDKVICVRSSPSVHRGQMYTLDRVGIFNVHLVERDWDYAKDRFILALKNNKLNRKLYPDAIEVSGYLRID